MSEFERGDRDEAYWEWLRVHPGGYVLELAHGKGKLHKAGCPSIRKPHGVLTKHGKFCGLTRKAVEEWASRQKEPAKPCQRCLKE